MEQAAGFALADLRVDGGATTNDFLLQFQADLLGRQVTRPQVSETTALGAAFLAGLAVGFWQDRDELAALWAKDRTFTPALSDEARNAQYRAGKPLSVIRRRGGPFLDRRYKPGYNRQTCCR
jgi:glycerol kinase